MHSTAPRTIKHNPTYAAISNTQKKIHQEGISFKQTHTMFIAQLEIL